MKKKFGIVLALILAVSLILVPAAVSASPGIGLNAVGSGTAEISIATAKSPTHSVKLYVEDGVADWAEVSIPVNIALRDITELKFWERIQSYGSSGWRVQVNLGIDVDNSGSFDADLPAWHRTGASAALGGDSFIALEQPVGGPSPATGSWVFVDSLNETMWWSPTVAYSTKADFLAALPSSGGITLDSIVREVILQIGGSGSWMDETAYIDDVTINGVTYDFEPTSSVGLTVAVPNIVAISVSPNSINFGTLLPGQISSVFNIDVDNIGTHQVNVDAEVSSGVFDYLELKPSAGSWGNTTPWTNIITGLDSGVSELLKTRIVVPSNYTPVGSETATLVFTATGT